MVMDCLPQLSLSGLWYPRMSFAPWPLVRKPCIIVLQGEFHNIHQSKAYQLRPGEAERCMIHAGTT